MGLGESALRSCGSSGADFGRLAAAPRPTLPTLLHQGPSSCTRKGRLCTNAYTSTHLLQPLLLTCYHFLKPKGINIHNTTKVEYRNKIWVHKSGMVLKIRGQVVSAELFYLLSSPLIALFCHTFVRSGWRRRLSKCPASSLKLELIFLWSNAQMNSSTTKESW